MVKAARDILKEQTAAPLSEGAAAFSHAPPRRWGGTRSR